MQGAAAHFPKQGAHDKSAWEKSKRLKIPVLDARNSKSKKKNCV